MNSLFKKPSAWIPIALSLTALTMMLITIALSGPSVHQKDEGIGAHLFQIWLVLEALMITFFAITWLPQKPMQALAVLTIQIIAVLAVCAPIFILEH